MANGLSVPIYTPSIRARHRPRRGAGTRRPTRHGVAAREFRRPAAKIDRMNRFFDQTAFDSLGAEIGEADVLEVLSTFLEDTASKMAKLAASIQDRPLIERAVLDACGKLRHLARGILQECAQHLEYVGFADLRAERIKGGLVEKSVHAIDLCCWPTEFARGNAVPGRSPRACSSSRT